jgi:hypothetical protein
MSEPFDAARRLYVILAATRGQDTTQPAKVVWARVLGVAPDNPAALFRGLAQLTDVTDELESAIKGRPDIDVKLFLGNLPAIRTAIGAMQLEAPWGNQHAPKLTEAAVRDLLYCSNELQRFQPEEKIAPEILDELRKEVDALFNDVLKADIDVELRKVLLTCLESFRRAIAEYRIRGAGGLREAAAKTFGELVLVHDKVNRKNPLIFRLGGIVMKAADAAATAMKFKSLVDVSRLALRAVGIDDESLLSVLDTATSWVTPTDGAGATPPPTTVGGSSQTPE